MLMTIRDKAQGWIAWLIVILISIPFALWGIQEYLGVGQEKIIAKVNDLEITERQIEQGAFELRNNLRQRLGKQYNADLFQESMLRNRVLENIIRDTLIQQASEELGLRVGDAALMQTILSIPAFQVDGQFNNDAYQRAVSLQGMTQQGFEESLRNNLSLQQLETVLQASAFASDDMVEQYQKLTNQQRKIKYLTLTTALVDQLDEPGDEQINDYYNANKKSFMAPERVKIDYLQLNLNSISAGLEASDDQLMTYYADHKAEFITPDKKTISHILVEDESLINDLSAQLKSGADFADLAKTHSIDTVSAELGGDLGVLESGLFDKAFEDAAVSLSLDQISEPVQTRFGYHLIKVTDVQKGDSDDFNAVKDQVKTAFLKTEAEQIFFDYAERLAILAYETPDSLVPAAEELNLTIENSDWVTRQGGNGVLANPKVINAAFSEEAITQGYNSEALEISPTEIVILRVAEHEAAAVKALDKVRDEVVRQLKNKAAFESLQTMVNAEIDALKSGEVAMQAIADAKSVELMDIGLLSRNANAVPYEIADAVFKMPLPVDGKARYQSVITGPDAIALIKLDEVIDGKAGDIDQAALTQLTSQIGSDQYEMFIESLKADAKIEYLQN